MEVCEGCCFHIRGQFCPHLEASKDLPACLAVVMGARWRALFASGMREASEASLFGGSRRPAVPRPGLACARRGEASDLINPHLAADRMFPSAFVGAGKNDFIRLPRWQLKGPLPAPAAQPPQPRRGRGSIP